MKKKHIAAISIVVVCIISFLFIKEYASPTNKSLLRDSDTGFHQGSKIEKQDVSSD